MLKSDSSFCYFATIKSDLFRGNDAHFGFYSSNRALYKLLQIHFFSFSLSSYPYVVNDIMLLYCNMNLYECSVKVTAKLWENNASIRLKIHISIVEWKRKTMVVEELLVERIEKVIQWLNEISPNRKSSYITMVSWGR